MSERPTSVGEQPIHSQPAKPARDGPTQDRPAQDGQTQDGPTQDGLDEGGSASAFAAKLNADLDRQLSAADAQLAALYPGDPTSRQPIHTVYIPADRFDAAAPASWGSRALALLDRYAPDAGTLAEFSQMPPGQVDEVYQRVVTKLSTEPIEDLRIDFEDGFGNRGDQAEDEQLQRVLAALGDLGRRGSRPPFFGIRFKSFEAPTRHRGVATLAGLVTGLTDDGSLPAGLVVTLPKVTSVDQVQSMTYACAELERRLGLRHGSLLFEIQVETSQAILGPDGLATIAPMVHAAEGRCFGLHYGTFDYSAGLGIAAAYQSLDHPVADHAKAVMQVAAAQTGVRLSDGSTNVVAFDDAEQARHTWSLHARLVNRSLQRGYYQGWDMHPGHLPTRYLATYAFFRSAMPDAAARLKAYVNRVEGGVMDEPATARMLATALLRGLHCGAVDEAEVADRSGLDTAALIGLTGTGQLAG